MSEVGDGNVGGCLHEELAAPVVVPSRLPDRVSVTCLLPAGRDRMQAAQQVIADRVTVWDLPAFRSQRWLSAAAEVLAGPEPLELFLQLDRVSKILTLELWAAGKVVFGLDDWIGI